MKMVNGKKVKESAEDLAQQATDKATFDAALPQRKLAMISLLNELAEQERLKYVTPGSAKAMEYQRKEVEATAILADPNPSSLDYPFAAANAASTGRTLTQVAMEWDSKAKAWAVIGADIADKTEQAIKAINALQTSATLENDAQAIIDSIVW